MITSSLMVIGILIEVLLPSVGDAELKVRVVAIAN